MSASECRVALPLIWMNGFPGTGKHTIGKLLATLLDEGEPLLINNHSLIDPVEAKFARDHPSYQQERRRAREAVFKNLEEDPALRDRIVIFTDFQSNNDLGSNVAREYEAAASRSRRLFLPVYLECDIKENTRRVANPQRGGSGTTKLLSPEIVAEMRFRCQLFRFDGVKGITLDVTSMRPEEAAEALAREMVE
ncbi:MAG: hypothetical protein Q9174_006278, partial [Haloplaca sp. 1 TL-2023]